jgi:hypothetical protein
VANEKIIDNVLESIDIEKIPIFSFRSVKSRTPIENPNNVFINPIHRNLIFSFTTLSFFFIFPSLYTCKFKISYYGACL